jgi:glycosyltransferase involved in cell wall biosynthesis
MAEGKRRLSKIKKRTTAAPYTSTGTSETTATDTSHLGPGSLRSLVVHASVGDDFEQRFVDAARRLFEQVHDCKAQSEAGRIAFVAPILPHTMVLDIWNATANQLGLVALVVTNESERGSFEQYVNYSNAQGLAVALEIKTLETMEENRTFLAGLDEELAGCRVVVALGETSLSTYQAMKHCRNHLKRLIVWQNAPRPLQSLPSMRQKTGFLQPALARERSTRREILRTCDALICFDKESATLAYLEGVSAQRIRRLSRGINETRYSEAFRDLHRRDIRKALGLSDDTLVFLQVGPLEVESGIFDTIFAFKNLLQSQTSLVGKVKLVCCGQGSSGADVRQMVVDLGLDDSVYFLSQSSHDAPAVRGDHLSHLVAVADVIIHNPVCPTGGEPYRFLDVTADLLCAASYGIPIISNGFGWVGEWLSRFGKSFSPGNIHSQSRIMRDALEKRDRSMAGARSAKRAIEHDLRMETTVTDFVKVIRGLTEEMVHPEGSDTGELFEQIDRHVQARQYLDAIQAIEAAFQMPGLKPSQQSWLFRTVGDCFTRLGDLDSGQQNYLRAADLDPYCHRVYVGLGTVALQAKQYNVAVPHFHKAIALAPKDDMANLGLGLAFEGLGEPEQSLKWTIRSCELNPENKAALYHLVKLSYEIDNYEDAIRSVERYVHAHPYDVHMIYTLGGLLYKCDQIPGAVALMESILRIDPMNNLAHSLLAQINRESKQRAMRVVASGN